MSYMLATILTAIPPQFAWAFPSADVGNTVQANVMVTDSASTPVMANSVKSGTITLNPALAIPSISPTIRTIDSGQGVTFSSAWTGGTPTYGASIYSSSTTTCNTQSTLVQQDIGLSSNTVTFSPVYPDSTTYYCIYVTDNALNSPSVTQPISSGVSTPGQIAFSPSGTYAYMTNQGSNNVIIINTASNTITGVITAGFNSPEGVAISPSGTYAYVTNSGSNNVVIINTTTNTVVNSITSGFSVPHYVAFSPSGTYAYVTNCNTPCGNNIAGNVVIINTATNSVTDSITSGFTNPTGVAFSPDGSYAYVVNSYTGNVVYINTATNTVINSINVGSNPVGVAFSPSGTYAYVSHNYYAGPLGVIDTATNTVTAQVPAYADSSHSVGVAFSPSGRYAYVSTLNSVLIINPGVQTTNSINSEVTVNPTLSAPAISPSNPPIDSGQSVNLTVAWTGGTSPYTVKYYLGTSATCSSDTTLVATHSSISGTSNTLSVSPTSSTYYCATVTDSATTPETTTSGATILGTWTAQNSLLNTFSGGSCVLDANTIFCADGNIANTVESAPITNNVIGTWTSQNSLLNIFYTGSCVLDANTIFCADGGNANTVESNPITNNVIGTWTSQNSLLNTFRSGSCVLDVNTIFCVDGYPTYNTVESAPITNNVIGTWTSQNSLLNSFFGGSCVLDANTIFCADGNIANTVESAQITDNVIGTWTAQNSLLNNMDGGSCVLDANTIFCAGGGVLGSNTVESAPILTVGSTEVVVNPALGIPTLTASNTLTVYAGNYEAFGSSWSGGTPPYTANYQVFNTTTGTVISSALYTGITGTSNTFLWLVPAAAEGNTVSANVLITDSASTPESANSASTAAITIPKSKTNSVSNPYAGGPTGYFGPNSTLSSSTTSTSTSSSTSTILPATTITQITASPGATLICNDTSGYYIHYPSLNATFHTMPGLSGCFSITAVNVTPEYRALNHSVMVAINYSFSNMDVSSNITIHYPCGTAPSTIAPFILRNGTWDKINPFILNVAACTITFAAPVNPVIAILNTSTSTSVAVTTYNATTVQTTISAQTPTQQQSYLVIAVIIIVIIAAAILVYIRIRR